jgi:hypothetical protein
VTRGMASLILPAALAAAAPVGAEEIDLFRAMATLISGQPASVGPGGEIVRGDVVSFRSSQGGAFGGPSATGEVYHPGSADCTIQQIWATQEQKEWARVTVVTYDFRKLTKVRYLADGDDTDTAPSREPDDPAVTTIILSAPQWQCSRHIAIDPAEPVYESNCQDDWWITALEPEDRRVVARSLDTIGAECGAPAG